MVAGTVIGEPGRPSITKLATFKPDSVINGYSSHTRNGSPKLAWTHPNNRAIALKNFIVAFLSSGLEFSVDPNGRRFRVLLLKGGNRFLKFAPDFRRPFFASV